MPGAVANPRQFRRDAARGRGAFVLAARRAAIAVVAAGVCALPAAAQSQSQNQAQIQNQSQKQNQAQNQNQGQQAGSANAAQAPTNPLPRVTTTVEVHAESKD